MTWHRDRRSSFSVPSSSSLSSSPLPQRICIALFTHHFDRVLRHFYSSPQKKVLLQRFFSYALSKQNPYYLGDDPTIRINCPSLIENTWEKRDYNQLHHPQSSSSSLSRSSLYSTTNSECKVGDDGRDFNDDIEKMSTKTDEAAEKDDEDPMSSIEEFPQPSSIASTRCASPGTMNLSPGIKKSTSTNLSSRFRGSFSLTGSTTTAPVVLITSRNSFENNRIITTENTTTTMTKTSPPSIHAKLNDVSRTLSLTSPVVTSSVVAKESGKLNRRSVSMTTYSDISPLPVSPPPPPPPSLPPLSSSFSSFFSPTIKWPVLFGLLSSKGEDTLRVIWTSGGTAAISATADLLLVGVQNASVETVEALAKSSGAAVMNVLFEAMCGVGGEKTKTTISAASTQEEEEGQSSRTSRSSNDGSGSSGDGSSSGEVSGSSSSSDGSSSGSDGNSGSNGDSSSSDSSDGSSSGSSSGDGCSSGCNSSGDGSSGSGDGSSGSGDGSSGTNSGSGDGSSGTNSGSGDGSSSTSSILRLREYLKASFISVIEMSLKYDAGETQQICEEIAAAAPKVLVQTIKIESGMK